MKPISLSFILLFFLYTQHASAHYAFNRQAVQWEQVPDTSDVFRNITDINRQIQRTTQNYDAQTPGQGQFSLPPQDTVPVNRQVIQINSFGYQNPLDSLYTRKANGTLMLPELYYNTEAMRGLSFRDTLFYNPLFLPMIFTGEMLPRDLSFYSTDDGSSKGMLIPKERTFAPQLQHIDFVNNVRRQYYLNYPERIRYSSLAHFDTIPPKITDQEVMEGFNPFRELIQAQTDFSLDAPDVEKAEIRRKYWLLSGEHSLQFSQNYFSENWHKGGTSNMNINNLHIITANYHKEKVKFNNTLEWRLSLYTAPDDTLRKYRIGNDLIRYYGDFGIDAFAKGWSYSTNLEVKSQLFNNYPPNSNELRSAFLSPLYVNAGVGLKYEMDKRSDKVRHRRVRWTLALAPISFNYKYVINNNVDVERYGIPEGKKSVFDIGSTINSILKYDITRYITWDSRFTYFTSYSKVMAEFENSLNMSLSNAFSTRIYVNVRFDDSVPPHPDYNFFQVNEMLSFGLNYKW